MPGKQAEMGNPRLGERIRPTAARRNHDWDYLGSDTYRADRKRCRSCGMAAQRSGFGAPLHWKYAPPGQPFRVSKAVPPCTGPRPSADDIAAQVEREDELDVLRSLQEQRLELDRREYAAITALRDHSATWVQIAEALGQRSKQGAQGYYRKLRWRINRASRSRDEVG